MKSYKPIQQIGIIKIGGLLLLALGVGLVYLFLLPPWQQNDEPTQFEYVWLIAHLNHWPHPGDYNAQMRREVVSSMVEHGFYHNEGKLPDLISAQPVEFGASQLGGQPLYYFLASIPLRLFPYTDVTYQFYLARLVSLMLLLVTVYFSYKTSQLLFDNSFMSILLPIFIALLPQFVYRMTAINDDAAAIASMTFFIWMSTRGIMHGADWKFLLGLIIAIIACYLAKPTAWLAVPFGIFVIFLSMFHKERLAIWIVTAFTLIIFLTFTFDWNASIPAYFYTTGGDPQRKTSLQSVDGDYVFIMDERHTTFYQVLDMGKLDQSLAQTNDKVTIGAWVWASQPVKVNSIQLFVDDRNILQESKLAIDTNPKFVEVSGEIPYKPRRVYINLTAGKLSNGVEVFWDCLILVPGEFSSQNPPQKSNQCTDIRWDGFQGKNLIRNPSAEMGWFPFRAPVNRLVSGSFKLQASDFWALLDPPASWTYFRQATEYLFRTFWGRFNWGTLPLAGDRPYRIFILLTVLAITGNIVGAIWYVKVIRWNEVLFLLSITISGLFYVIFRFAGEWNHPSLLPQARYFFPYILPTAFFLLTGWISWSSVIMNNFKRKGWHALIFVLLLLGYNCWAWYTIWRYWYY